MTRNSLTKFKRTVRQSTHNLHSRSVYIVFSEKKEQLWQWRISFQSISDSFSIHTLRPSRYGGAFMCLGGKTICQCLILLHVNWNVYIGLCKCTVFWLLVNFKVNLFTQRERLILTLHEKKTPFHILLYGNKMERYFYAVEPAVAQRPIPNRYTRQVHKPTNDIVL